LPTFTGAWDAYKTTVWAEMDWTKPRNMNAKNKKEANRSGRSINLEVLPSEADKKNWVVSFGDKGGD